MRLRYYELYAQPRAKSISSRYMVIQMHRITWFLRFRMVIQMHCMAYYEIRLTMINAEKVCDIYVCIIVWETIQVLR